MRSAKEALEIIGRVVVCHQATTTRQPMRKETMKNPDTGNQLAAPPASEQGCSLPAQGDKRGSVLLGNSKENCAGNWHPLGLVRYQCRAYLTTPHSGAKTLLRQRLMVKLIKMFWFGIVSAEPAGNAGAVYTAKEGHESQKTHGHARNVARSVYLFRKVRTAVRGTNGSANSSRGNSISFRIPHTP